MKKYFAAASFTLAAGLTLTACGGTAASPAAPTVSPAADAQRQSAAPAPTIAAASEKSSRGNLIKAVGQGASVTVPSGATAARFVVKAIEVDPKCTAPNAKPAENGHLVVLTVDAETTAALGESSSKTFSLAGMGWKAVAENGTTQNASTFSSAAYFCVPDAERFPSGMGPAEKATGKVVLDVVSPGGTLIYAGLGMPAGWEWNYPAK